MMQAPETAGWQADPGSGDLTGDPRLGWAPHGRLHRARPPARRRPAHPPARPHDRPRRVPRAHAAAGHAARRRGDAGHGRRGRAASRPRSNASTGTRLVAGPRRDPRPARRARACSTPSSTCIPDAVVGYLGMERDEITHEPRDYYAKLPPAGGPARAGRRPDARDRRVGHGRRALREGGRRRRHRVRVRGGRARGPRADAGRPSRRAGGRGGAGPAAERPTRTSCPASATSATGCTGRSERRGPPSYARPAASGGRTFPTNPASTTIVTTYGVIRTNSGGIRLDHRRVGQTQRDRLREPEDERREHQPHRVPVRQDQRGERDEPQAERLPLAPAVGDLDGQERAGEPGEGARQQHALVPQGRDPHAEGAGGLGVLAARTQPQSPPRPVQRVGRREPRAGPPRAPWAAGSGTPAPAPTAGAERSGMSIGVEVRLSGLGLRRLAEEDRATGTERGRSPRG